MPDNVYEIRFTGDAAVLASEATKAKAAVTALGAATQDVDKSTQLYEGTTRGLTRSLRLAAFQMSYELNPALGTMVSTLDRAALAMQLTGGRLGVIAAAAVSVGAALTALIGHLQKVHEEAVLVREAVRTGDVDTITQSLSKLSKEYVALAENMSRAGAKSKDANEIFKEMTSDDIGVAAQLGRLAKLGELMRPLAEYQRNYAKALADTPALSSFFAAADEDINKVRDAMLDLKIKGIETINAISAARREQLGFRADIARTQSEFLAPFNITALRESINLQKQALDLRLKELEALKSRPGIMPGEREVLEAQQKSIPLQKLLLDLQTRQSEQMLFAEKVRLQAVEAGDAELVIAEQLTEAERQVNDLIRARHEALRSITPLRMEELQAFASFAAVSDDDIAKVNEAMRRLLSAQKVTLSEQAEALRDQARKFGLDYGVEFSQGIVEAEQRGAKASFLLRIFRAPQEAALSEANAVMQIGATLGEQFSAGFQGGVLRLQDSFGTFGQNMARLTEGIGNSMLRGMDDTFFEVVHGRFKSLPNIAKAAGEGVIRELTGAFSRFAMRSVFDRLGLSFLADSPAGGGAEGGVAQAGQGFGFLASLFGGRGGSAASASQMAALTRGLPSAERAEFELATSGVGSGGSAFLGMTARGVGQGFAVAGGALQTTLAFLASAKSGRPGSGILGGAMGGAIIGATFGGPIGAAAGAIAGATISAIGSIQGRRKPLKALAMGAPLGIVGILGALAATMLGQGPAERRNPFGIPIKVGRDDREPWDQVEREMQNNDRLLTYARAILDGASVYDAMERARQGDPTARDDNFRRSAELFAEFIWPQVGGPFLQQAQQEKDRAENQRRLEEERRRLEAERERQIQESVRGAFFEGGVLTAQDVQNAEDRRIFEAGRFEREVFLTGRAEAGRTALARMGPGRVRAILEPGFIKQMEQALGRSDIQQLIAEGLRTWLRDRDFDLIEDVRDVGI